jgi:GntR family transcriptional regulator
MTGMVKGADARPLYAQVRDTLVERIHSGAWKPGQLLPNEFEIAAELGVSQGTARKALDSLATDNLVVRRQGRGTFVVEHTPANMLFRFFNIFKDGGAQILPESEGAAPKLMKSTTDEQKALELGRDDKVIRVERVRRHNGKPFIAEVMVLPARLYPGLADRSEVPNTVYDLFQKDYGLLVARAEERITAVLAGPNDVKALGIAAGAPLLRISRIAYGLDDVRLEWRVSLCQLDEAHYLARLR